MKAREVTNDKLKVATTVTGTSWHQYLLDTLIYIGENSPIGMHLAC